MDPLVTEGDRRISEAALGGDVERSTEVLVNISASLSKLGRDLEGLGTPPQSLAESADLLDRSLDRLALAYSAAADAIESRDGQALSAAQRTVDEGVELAGRSSAAVGECSSS